MMIFQNGILQIGRINKTIYGLHILNFYRYIVRKKSCNPYMLFSLRSDDEDIVLLVDYLAFGQNTSRRPCVQQFCMHSIMTGTQQLLVWFGLVPL